MALAAMVACAFAVAGPVELIRDINRSVSPDGNAGTLMPLPQVSEAPALGAGRVVSMCGGHRCGAWITDGTSANTRLLKSPAGAISEARGFVRVGSHVYFVMRSSEGDLWRTDGTPEGTAAIPLPTIPDISFDPQAIGDRLVFVAQDGSVWGTDGTEAGTVKVRDPFVGFHQRFLLKLEDGVYFAANDGASGTELWRTDGTLAGTTLAVDIDPGPSSGFGASAVSDGKRLVFFAVSAAFGHGVFASDGTAAGTYPIVSSVNLQSIRLAGGVNGATQFLIETNSSRTQLWRTDGTPAGSYLLKGWDGRLGWDPAVVAGTLAYFVVSDPAFGQELWRTDGTEAGTMVVQDINPGPGTSSPRALAAHGGLLYFVAGNSLWRSAGDAPSTEEIEPSSALLPWISIGGALLLYRFNDSFSTSVLVSDGSLAGTSLLEPATGEPTNSSRCTSAQAKRAGIVYFFATDAAHGCELWRSDGTEAGTMMVKDVRPGFGTSSRVVGAEQLVATSSAVFFVADDGLHGFELWKSDGTEAGTTLVGETLDGPGFSAISSLTAVGDTVYFAAGNVLWMAEPFDGYGSVRQVPHNWDVDGAPRFPTGLARLGSLLLFSGNSQLDGVELWRTDGSLFGMQPLTAGIWEMSAMVRAGSRVFFTAFEPGTGTELWTSDGTQAGTRRVTDLRPGPLSGAEQIVGAIGAAVLFTSTTDSFQQELWRSDGTEAGTLKLGLLPGTIPHPGWTVGDKLYYSVPGTGLHATDGWLLGTLLADCCSQEAALLGGEDVLFFGQGTTLRMPWLSSGTPAGTLPVPGAASAGLLLDDFATLTPVPSVATGAIFLLSAGNAGSEPYLLARDAQPEALSFAPRTGVLANSIVVSDPVAVTGISVPASATASGGDLCVSSTPSCSCDLAAFASSAVVEPNDFICARHVASPLALTTVTTTITVGGFAAAFSSTTGASNPATLSFGSAGHTVSEDGTVTIAIHRAGALDAEVSVQWSTADGTALAGADYATASGTLYWPAGDGAPKTLVIGGASAAVALTDDVIVEGEEQFSLVLSAPSGGAVLGALGATQVKVTDHADFIELDAATIRASEAGPNVALRVVRLGPRTGSATVAWRTVNGTAAAGVDFGATGSASLPSGVLTFAPGEVQKIISIGPQASADARVPLINDATPEPGKTFGVLIENPSGGPRIGALGSATVTIGSEDAAVAMEAPTLMVRENEAFAAVNVVRRGFGAPVSVSIFTLDGTAVAGSHYGAVATTLSWDAFDESPRTVSIPIVANSVGSGALAFTVRLAGVNGAQLLAPASTVVTISDVDSVAQFAPVAVSISESAGTAVLTVTRTGSSAQAASIDWSTADNLAAAGVDYIAGSGTVHWAAGDSSPKTILVALVADSAPEPAKTFKVALANAVGTTLGANSIATVTIVDDDAGFVFSSPTVDVSEAAAAATLQVLRLGPGTAAASVRWATANGTATAGQDFGTAGNATQRSGILSWAAGDVAPKSVTIPILKDTRSEGDETFEVRLSGPSAGMATGSPVIVRIVDDEIPAESRVSLAAAKVTVLENGGSAVLTVRREAIAGGFTAPLTVGYATVAGSALATSDFASRSGSLAWSAADAADKTITVPIVNNLVAEAHEAFKVVLSLAGPGATLDQAEATVTIIDDDEAFPKFGAVPDGWETPVDANAGWHASNDPGAYEGVFSLRSDAIDDGEVAQLEVTRVFAAGNIAFRVKVSSEAGFDKLRFFVDGVEKGAWSGTAVPGWQVFTVPVSAGTHTIRWSYEKDASATIGFDAAWIDAVTLP